MILKDFLLPLRQFPRYTSKVIYQWEDPPGNELHLKGLFMKLVVVVGTVAPLSQFSHPMIRHT